jgi:tellurium resistance protein TerD
MAVILVKGGNLSLTRETPNLKRVLVGLGWDARTTAGDDFDLDASVFMVGGNGKVRRDEDFIFYHQLESLCGSVKHTGDNRTGAGEGDDEAIEVALKKVPDYFQRLVVCVTIHDADVRRQNFGQVRDAFIRLVNLDNDQEIVRFDLAEDYSTETAMIFGEIYRHGGEWKFKAVGQGYPGSLEALCRQFGVTVLSDLPPPPSEINVVA